MPDRGRVFVGHRVENQFFIRAFQADGQIQREVQGFILIPGGKPRPLAQHDLHAGFEPRVERHDLDLLRISQAEMKFFASGFDQHVFWRRGCHRPMSGAGLRAKRQTRIIEGHPVLFARDHPLAAGVRNGYGWRAPLLTGQFFGEEGQGKNQQIKESSVRKSG